MKNILLFGGGGHCHACIDVIETENRFVIAGVVAHSIYTVQAVLGYSILGSDDQLPTLLKKTKNALVAVGQIKSPNTRIRLYDLLKSCGAELPIIKSPNGYCSSHATVGEGSILMHGSLINARAVIGANCIINSQALIEHDVVVSDHCHISTGARVNGGVRIGSGSFIGSGVVVKEGVEIGDHAVIAAGQIVLKDIPSGAILKGNS